jgi:hypothetical protein
VAKDGEKLWRMEVSNPLDPTGEWRTVFKFNDDELLKFQELGIELDRTNNPVRHRIVRNSLESSGGER